MFMIYGPLALLSFIICNFFVLTIVVSLGDNSRSGYFSSLSEHYEWWKSKFKGVCSWVIREFKY